MYVPLQIVCETRILEGQVDMSQKVRDTDLEKTQQVLQGAFTHGRQIIAPLTRRTFFMASPTMAAGLGFVVASGGAREARAQSAGGSAISSNFNGTDIPGVTGSGSRAF
jgi:hypothetical protein